MAAPPTKPYSFTYDPKLSVEEQWKEPDIWTLELSPSTLELFSRWCGVTDEQEIRRRALRVHDWVVGRTGQTDAKRTYKCVWQYWFLRPMIGTSPTYQALKAEGRLATARILDVGCCMGTDLRYMLCDGATDATGVDYSETFVQAGFVLFGDEDRMKDRIFQVDFLEGADLDATKPQDPLRLPVRLSKMAGQYDVILASMVLHVFEDRREVAEFIRRGYALLKPGGIFFGRNRPLWMHTADSLAEELRAYGFEGVSVEPDKQVHTMLRAEAEKTSAEVKLAFESVALPTCFHATKPR